MMNKNKITALALVACFCTGYSNAAEANNDLDVFKLDDIVVTATRTKLAAKEVPNSVEVITKEDIKNIGAGNVKEALRLATNVNLPEATGTGNSLSIRGSVTNDVLVLINGRRAAGEGFGQMISVNTYALERINLSSVERIEVLRGPAGALYGADAAAGVINVITRRADKPGFSVGAMSNSREMSNWYRFDSGKNGKLSAVLDANFTKVRRFQWEDAMMTRYYGPKQNYNLNLEYEMDKDNSVALYTEYDKQNLQYQINGMSSLNKYKSERKTVGLIYAGKSEKSNYTFGTSYSELDKKSGMAATKEYKFWNFEARDTIETAENNRLTVGTEYRADMTPVSGIDKRTGQYALYVHDEYRLGDKLLLIPSVRYDHHDTYGSHTSPSIGATYFLTDNSRFKVSYGSGYRAPSTTELYSIGTGGAMSIGGNENLKPEKSKGYEISYEQEGKTTAGKLTYFNNKKRDQISVEHIGSDYHYVNIGRSETEGIEVELKKELAAGLMLSGNYEYLDAFNKETNSRLSYSARNTYTVKLSYTEPVKKEWNVTMWNRWFSDYNVSGKNYSLNTFNFVVNKNFGEHYNVYAGLDNIFDKKNTPMRYAGRIWRVGAEMNF
ncbi:MAG TPA: TonB-dependent receptor [Candidatus Avacidaminococcus intestinavium]|uniref:TonB-dependent receptor n=1 Tax=Candidatus Avacidaminococcus intestinavium TaxID=2840684 RepID=A0A9D1MP19_9FIRM|nr:TonB-dependent receptor [Candidatus Avacidaminococcus intestinavium]